MLYLVLLLGLTLWSSLAEAIRWDFDDGTTQGWAAKEAGAAGGSSEFNLFPGQVADGVWTIDVSPSVAGEEYPSPSVQLISSTIGYDSGLFDRVRVRFRTVHHVLRLVPFGFLGPMSTTAWSQVMIQSVEAATGFRLSDDPALSIRPNGRKWR